MRYYALACDYDGTLALHGKVDTKTVAALERLRESGRKLLLVTGRRLEEAKEVLPEIALFDRVVAEDGALVYRPDTREVRLLGEPPPPGFVEELRRRGVQDVAEGSVIVATWEPHQHTVFDVIREMGIEYQVIFNKGAVMVLPSGINKAVGLRAALRDLLLSRHNVAGVGDAENDHAFLSLCEFSAAVANALPVIQKHADLVTSADHGAGVQELVRHIVRNDLADFAPKLSRHRILLGNCPDGEEVRVPPYGGNLLLAGTSGSGKSTIATSFVERLAEHEYQFCIIDPEGDYSEMEGVVVLGDPRRAPTVQEVVRLLERPGENCAINMVGIRMEDRPPFFESLFHALLDLRTRTGRPHWMVIDEAHHLLPASWSTSPLAIPRDLCGVFFITVHPEHVAKPALSLVDTVITIGEDPVGTIASFSRAVGHRPPAAGVEKLERGEALAWKRGNAEPFLFRTIPPRAERRRHLRKYALGELPPDRSFWFRGPGDRQKLRAQNLTLFLQIGDGVDDDTWMHHLRGGDYSRWFRQMIKDPRLAEEVAAVEEDPGIDAAESRRRIREVVEEHYTAPA